MKIIDRNVADACKFLDMPEPSFLEFKFSERKGKINSLVGRGVYTVFDQNEVYYVGMSNTAKTGGMRLRFLSHLRKLKRSPSTFKVYGTSKNMTASWAYFLDEYVQAMDIKLDNLAFRAYHMLDYKPSKILALESILIDRLQPIANDEVYLHIMESNK